MEFTKLFACLMLLVPGFICQQFPNNNNNQNQNQYQNFPQNDNGQSQQDPPGAYRPGPPPQDGEYRPGPPPQQDGSSQDGGQGQAYYPPQQDPFQNGPPAMDGGDMPGWPTLNQRPRGNVRTVFPGPMQSAPPPPNPEDHIKNAIVVLGNSDKIKGIVKFAQDQPGDPVRITGTITGLTANTEHGFHVHQLGDLSNGCTSAGSHFNPRNLTHGSPNDEVRHVGDLGNVKSDENGTVTVQITDRQGQIALGGGGSIIGRALVIHEKVDDLGLGASTSDTKTTGNAGGRLACGVIGIAASA